MFDVYVTIAKKYPVTALVSVKKGIYHMNKSTVSIPIFVKMGFAKCVKILGAATSIC